MRAPSARASNDLLRRTLVSVVIPCYNYEKFVGSAIVSVLSQVDVDVEVIVVDDFSNDGSLQVATKIAERDNRVRVVAHHVNFGPVRTFNDGLALVRGEFIVRLDADDMLTPGSLSRSVALAVAHPSVGLVYGHPIHFIESQSPSSPAKTWGRPVTVAPGAIPEYSASVKFWTLTPGHKWVADRCRSGLNVITSPEALMRRSVVDEVGGQKNLAHAHDMEMWFRIAAHSDVGYISGADQAFHREHPDSLSVRGTGPLTDLEERRDAFRLLFEHMGASIPSVALLEKLAYGALARQAIDRANRSYDRNRADAELVRDLENFALTLVPDVGRWFIYRTLMLRRRIFGKLYPKVPLFIAAIVRRRFASAWAGRRWAILGV